jgi:hypothetical protein
MKKYLLIALALSALVTAGAAPVLAQSFNDRAGTFTDRNSQASPPAYSNSDCTGGCDGGGLY